MDQEILLADALFDELTEFRIANAQPSPRRDSVRLVLEPFREYLIPLFQHVVLQNLRMDLRNAVDMARTVHGKIGHVDYLVLRDCQSAAVEPALHQFSAKPCVDLVYDIENLRKNFLEQIHVPFLQSLSHDGVVRVIERFLGDYKRLLESQPLFLEKPDQFRNADRRMRVVQLDRHVIRELFDRPVLPLIPEQDVLQGSAGEEILLFQSELLAGRRGIVRIQNAGNVLDRVLFQYRQRVFLIVEQSEVKLLDRLALPEPQRPDVFRFVTDNRHIIRNRADGLVRELHQHFVRSASAAPGISALLPVVCVLDLKTVVKTLFEQSIFISESVSGQGEIHRRRRVQITSSQSSETAVAESGVLDLLEHVDVQSLFFELFLDIVQNTQREQIVVHHPPDQILRAEIIGFPYPFMGVPAFIPVLRDRVHDHFSKSIMDLLGRCVSQTDLFFPEKHELHLFHNFIDMHSVPPNCYESPSCCGAINRAS